MERTFDQKYLNIIITSVRIGRTKADGVRFQFFFIDFSVFLSFIERGTLETRSSLFLLLNGEFGFCFYLFPPKQ